ncbi:MAG TPA: hypothetical protein VIG24_10420 [Acidimicrobiia bacterium]
MITVDRHQALRAASFVDLAGGDVKIACAGRALILKSSGPGRSARAQITGETTPSKGWSYTCPQGQLSAAFRAMTGDQVELDSDRLVRSGKLRLHLFAVDQAEDAFTEIGEETIHNIKRSLLREAIAGVAWALPPAADSRAALQGINLSAGGSKGDELWAAATDGNRIAYVRVVAGTHCKVFAEPMTLGPEVLKMLRPLIDVDRGTVAIRRSGKWIEVESHRDGVRLTMEAKAVGLPFPPYRQLFPLGSAGRTIATVGLVELTDGLRFLVDSGTTTARVRLLSDSITVTDATRDARFEAAATCQASEHEVGVNARHLLDALRAAAHHRLSACGTAHLSLGRPSEPIVISREVADANEGHDLWFSSLVSAMVLP